MLMNSPTPNVAPLFERNASRLLQPPTLLLLQGRPFPHRRPDERGNHQVTWQYDRRSVERIEPAVEISPVNNVQRRAVTWDGMAAEIVQTTSPERIEVRYRGPRHLLVVMKDYGVRVIRP
jgi:hypothetical protein